MTEFLNRANITYTTPGIRDNVYLGSFNKVKKYAQKRYLLWRTRDILEILNGSKVLESSVIDNFKTQFGKEITFRQVCPLLKQRKQYIFNKRIPQWSCLCEICENAIFLVHGMNKKLFPECPLPVTVDELVAKFSCVDEAEDCMVGKCDVRSTSQISIDNFKAESTSESDSSCPSNISDIEEENENVEEHFIANYKWTRGQDNR